MKINLLSDEKSEELNWGSSETSASEPELPQQEKLETGFSDTLFDSEPPAKEEPETEEPVTDESVLSTPPFTSFETDETKPPKKKSGTFILAFFLIFVLAGAAYWYIIRPSKEKKPSFPPADSLTVDISKTAEEPVGKDVPVEEALPVSAVTAFEKEVLTSIQGGVAIITGVINVLPDGANISVLTYHGDRSLTIQSMAPSVEKLNVFYQALQSEFPGTTMKSDLDKQVVAGRSTNRMTISASGFELKEPITTAKVQMLDVPQLKSKVEQLATDAGVKVQSVSGGIRSFTNDELVRTPLSIRLTGAQNAGLSFLEELATAHLNLRFSKIMLLSSNRIMQTRGNVDFILYVELVRPS